MRSSEAELIPDEVHQKRPRLNRGRPAGAIDVDRYCMKLFTGFNHRTSRVASDRIAIVALRD
jgi:hypothetical protein